MLQLSLSNQSYFKEKEKFQEYIRKVAKNTKSFIRQRVTTLSLFKQPFKKVYILYNQGLRLKDWISEFCQVEKFSNISYVLSENHPKIPGLEV